MERDRRRSGRQQILCAVVLHVVLFGLAAAIYPQLLAVVLLILALPNARALLWVCCIAGVASGVLVNLAIFAALRSRGTVAGSSESRLGSGAYIGIGAATLLIALLIGTTAGRALLGRGRDLLPARIGGGQGDALAAAVPGDVSATNVDVSEPGSGWRARLDAALHGGSVIVAAITGILLAMPGPFDFLASGRLARDHRGWIEALIAILVFAALKFMLIEIPSLAYLVDPEGTASSVSRLSVWLADNKLVAAALFVGLVGVLLLGQGVAGIV